MNEEKKNVEAKTSPSNLLGDDVLFGLTDKILSLQRGAKKWGMEEHCLLLALIAEEFGLPTAAKKDFRLSLSKLGLGGNASQYRQFLSSEKGGRRIAPSTTSALADEYDAL